MDRCWERREWGMGKGEELRQKYGGGVTNKKPKAKNAAAKQSASSVSEHTGRSVIIEVNGDDNQEERDEIEHVEADAQHNDGEGGADHHGTGNDKQSHQVTAVLEHHGHSQPVKRLHTHTHRGYINTIKHHQHLQPIKRLHTLTHTQRLYQHNVTPLTSPAH